MKSSKPTQMKPKAEPVDLYYIQGPGVSGNDAYWWREHGAGYTRDIREAWKLTRDEALRIVGPSKTDRMFPVSIIDGLAEHHVDVQVIATKFKTTQFERR